MVSALQSGSYELIWETCADLPSPLYSASVAVHDNKVYTTAGGAPDRETYDHVYVYDVNRNQWDRLPPPGQRHGTLQIISGKLTVIGGWDATTKKRTNKVTTYNNNRWSNEYPNLSKARDRPGVLTHQDYVIVAGGALDDNTFNDDIELLNYKQSSPWVIARMKLPGAMRHPSLTISDNILYIVGYDRPTDRTNAAYKVSIDTVTSSVSHGQLTSIQTADWTKLPPAPNVGSAIIPNTSPPMIVGGYDKKYVPAADIRVLDTSENSWKVISSLTTARAATAVVSINCDSILIIGGFTCGIGISECRAHSISTVEKGTIRLCCTQKAADIHNTK